LHPISGHKSLKEVERYTAAVSQARLARAAMERIGSTSVETAPVEVLKSLIERAKNSG